MINLKFFCLFVLTIFLISSSALWVNPKVMLDLIVITVVYCIFIKFFDINTKKFNFNKPVVPIYKLKEKYNPVVAGYLYDGSFQIKDWYAGVVYLIQNNKVILFKKDNKYYVKVNFNEIKETIDILDLFLLKSIFYMGRCWMEIEREIVWECWSEPVETENMKKEICLNEIIKSGKNLLRENIFLGVYTEKSNFSRKYNVFLSFILLLLILGVIIILGDMWNGWVLISSLLYISLFGLWFVEVNGVFATKDGWEMKRELGGLKEFFSKVEDHNLIHYNNLEEFLKNENAPYIIALSDNNDWLRFFN